MTVAERIKPYSMLGGAGGFVTREQRKGPNDTPCWPAPSSTVTVLNAAGRNEHPQAWSGRSPDFSPSFQGPAALSTAAEILRRRLGTRIWTWT